MTTRSLLKTAVAGGLFGVGAYVGADVYGEYSTYCVLHAEGMKFAEQDDQLKEQIGTPFVSSPWYNASIGFTQSGHIAAITFPLKGSRQITDVSVRAVRRPGVSSTALYNLTGGEWKVLDASAMAPQQGGLVRPRSIVPYQAVPKVVDGKVIEGEECEECNRKAADASGTGTAAQAGAGAAQGKAVGAAAGAAEGAAAAAGGGQVEGGTPSAPAGEAGSQQAAGNKKPRRRFWFF